MKQSGRVGVFVRMFSSAVLMQSLLSACNLAVGLVLIRLTTDVQYGYYVLVMNTLVLLTSLQNAYVQPPLVLRMVGATPAQRAALIGGVFKGQQRVVLSVGAAVAATLIAVRLGGWVDGQFLVLMAAGSVAAMAAFYREFFRMVLLAYRLPQSVLKADVLYVALLIPGAALATMTPVPAAGVCLALAAAAAVGGRAAARALRAHAGWDSHGSPRALLELASIGGWSTAGCAAHWSFSQGYNYVVAGTLDIASVAALAATRLLMMPINLLSSGIGSLMMPTATSWLHAHGPAVVFRRLALIAACVALLAVCYIGVLWLLQDWIFSDLMHKHFVQGRALLAIWSCVFLVMIFRDQLLFLPGSSGMFKALTLTTGVSAVVSLSFGYLAIQRIGLLGAPLAVLGGEVVNVGLIIILSMRRIRHVGLRPAFAA